MPIPMGQPTSPIDSARTSVVICAYLMHDLLLRCLTSLHADSHVDFDIILVLNTDPVGTAQEVRALFPDVRLIVNERNRGVGPARNQGLAIARGDVIVLLDADTVVDPAQLAGLADTLRAHADVGVIGPQLMSPEGARQATARTFPTVLTKVRRRLPRRLIPYLPSDEIAPGPVRREVGYVIGACQAIRKEALGQVGLLDERIFYGPEDVDLCLRMWQSGWRVLWDPTWHVIHHEQRITKRRVLSRITLRHAAGLAYYFFKHRYAFRPPGYGATV